MTRRNEENVLKIVGMHLNKGNSPRSVTQVESLSKSLGNSLRVAPKQRQAQLVKKQIIDFVNGFLRKKKKTKNSKTVKYIDSEKGHISIGPEYGKSFLEIRYKLKDFLKEEGDFFEYYQYYHAVGQHKKKDLMLPVVKFEDPAGLHETTRASSLNNVPSLRELRLFANNNNVWSTFMETQGPDSPVIYIKHKDMRSILSMPFIPDWDNFSLDETMKAVYNLSRTHGFFKPSEVNRYANLIVDFYVKKKVSN